MDFTLEADDLSGVMAERNESWVRENPPASLAKLLYTDLQKGLDTISPEASKSLESRRSKYGENKVASVPPKTFFEFFWDALEDGTLRILMASSVLSIVLAVLFSDDPAHGWIEGFAILMAVFVVAIVTAANDHNKDQKFRKLNAISQDRQVKAIRDGIPQVVSIHNILVGDIVSLSTGDYVPADGIFVSGHALSIDESTMTGEPDAIIKGPDGKGDNYLIGGCMVMEGQGSMLVTAVGAKAQQGKMKAAIASINNQTPLEEKLESLAETIGKLGLGAALMTLAALVVKWFLSRFIWSDLGWEWNQAPILVDYIVTSVTIVVVAVPEGLPLAVTLALAYSVRKMMKDQNLVRHLAACETMGGATAICSDKTGTLTQNKMTVVKTWIASHKYETVLPKASEINPDVLSILSESICLNSTAYIVRQEGKASAYIGDKTECALLEFVEHLGFDYNIVRNQESSKIEKMYPFSSKRKRMSIVLRLEASSSANNSPPNSSHPSSSDLESSVEEVKNRKSPKSFEHALRFISKGASEVMLEKCTRYIGMSGTVSKLDSPQKLQLQRLITSWASEGLRTLCLCYTDVDDTLALPADEDDRVAPWNGNLILLGVFGIKDPLRPEVFDAVKTCKRAGITVRMLTGDNILTAKHIAEEAGIMDPALHEAIEGPHFRKLTNLQLDDLLPRLRVIARSSPEDKMRLVNRLRELGEVVAVTGDGTNDAPQLKAADVGFAMGIMGTEVAKEASDIILLDDNFSSIVKAVLWGRNVFDAIKKFVQFQLTVNIVAVSISFIGAVTGGDSPLKAVQLLWVNLIMDTLAALALATESPTWDLLDRPPYGRFARLITFQMWRNVIGQAAYQLFVLFFILYSAEQIPLFGTHFVNQSELVRSTLVFNSFVFCQVFNEINSRTLGNDFNPFKRFFSNSIFISVLGFTVIVQFLIVQFGGHVSETAPLTFTEWIFCVLVGSVSIPLGVLLRLIPVPDEDGASSLTSGSSAKGQAVSSAGPRPKPHSGDTPEVVRRQLAASRWATASNTIISQIRVTKAMTKDGK